VIENGDEEELARIDRCHTGGNMKGFAFGGREVQDAALERRLTDEAFAESERNGLGWASESKAANARQPGA
jgi:hypothetical protein